MPGKLQRVERGDLSSETPDKCMTPQGIFWSLKSHQPWFARRDWHWYALRKCVSLLRVTLLFQCWMWLKPACCYEGGNCFCEGPFGRCKVCREHPGILGTYLYTRRMLKSSWFAKYMPGPHLLNILNKDFKEKKFIFKDFILSQAETLRLTLEYLFVFFKGGVFLIFGGTHPWAEPGGGLPKSVLLNV